MGRIENAEVFRDTERMCRENGRLRAAIAASREGQRLIVEGSAVDGVDLNRFDAAAKVVVSPKRTFEAAVAYAGRMRTCAHNNARTGRYQLASLIGRIADVDIDLVPFGSLAARRGC